MTQVHTISAHDMPLVLAAAGIAFVVAMLAANWVRVRMWRALNRAKRTLRTLPDWCAYLLWLEEHRDR